MHDGFNIVGDFTNTLDVLGRRDREAFPRRCRHDRSVSPLPPRSHSDVSGVDARLELNFVENVLAQLEIAHDHLHGLQVL